MKGRRIFVCGLILAVVALWTFYPLWSYLFKDVFINSTHLDIGVFGDSYGALNTLFSGLAFTGIIVSIFLQSQELSETRKDINRQTKEFESQTLALKKQVFENTFFQLLSVFRTTTDGVYVNVFDDNGDVIEVINGRRAFTSLFKSHFNYVYIFDEDVPPIEIIREKYLSFDRRYGSSVGPYCRTLYQALKIIDDSEMDSSDKKMYANIVRAQLSLHELYIIFFCGLSEYGDGSFKFYLEKYEFFEHLPMNILPEKDGRLKMKDIVNLYNRRAYGKTNIEVINEFHAK
ncbi:putative phage abortive infection protein [Aeromonas bestiarum]|uniref:putative phage abortive infection protein n=1 Tax=Aeromonas bestiarum TaxID=105751 RepID=UPI0015E1617B|nr:putative phage abortive infection protein [Aeromonas bestiarum]